jgi:hypothetical protein
VDLAFLQHPVEVDELFRPLTRGVGSGKEILLDNLSLDVTGVTFRVHLPKGVFKSCQPIFPCGDGTFPDIKPPLLGKKLNLQLDSHSWRGHPV